MAVTDIAERIRSVLVEAAIRAYEDAGVRGVCAEGRWEAAVSAMRSLDLDPTLAPVKQPAPSRPT